MRLLTLNLLLACSLLAQSGQHARSTTLRVPAGYLGAGVVEVTPDRAKALKLPEAAGVEVKRVDENTPASRAGLKVDDVILEFNNQKVENIDQFIRFIGDCSPGTRIAMVVWREGGKRTLSATLAARPVTMVPGSTDFDGTIRAFPAPFDIEILPAPAPMIGIDGETLTPQLAQYFGVEQGVLVRTVNPKTPAEKAGLKAGDVIVKVNGVLVTSPREISSLLRAGRKPIAFTIVRNHKEITVGVELALEFDPCPNTRPDGLYLAYFRAR